MTINGWLQLAQEALKVPGLIVEIYGDLARPGVRQVGKALDTVLGLGNTILWPIVWTNERTKICLEKNLEKYRVRLEQIPVEKIVGVSPEIGVPIAEKLAYVRDERLSDLYVSLLAKASCSDTVSRAHPSFVNIVNNLSPDEALLLEHFVTNSNLICVTARFINSTTGIFSSAGDNLLAPEHLTSLTYASNVPAYLSNLTGLGLLSIYHDRFIADSDSAYAAVEAYWRTKFPECHPKHPERKLSFQRSAISITEFGKQFISACHGN